MNVVPGPILHTTGHCCACSVICHHIGPIRLCSDHQAPTYVAHRRPQGPARLDPLPPLPDPFDDEESAS